MMWSFTDKYSSIPSYFSGYSAALIFDESYRPKPAYYYIAKFLLNTKYKSQTRHYVFKSCGLPLTYQELIEIKDKSLGRLRVRLHNTGGNDAV
ncbi:MAG: endo-1,4-beta-xylanase [Candidatus Bathyarchaeia archaeon]